MADTSDNNYQGGTSIAAATRPFLASMDTTSPTYFYNNYEYVDNSGKPQKGVTSNAPVYFIEQFKQGFKAPDTAAPSNFKGGISFSPMSFSKSANGGWESKGGLMFDIDMATIAAFQNNAMMFTASNAEANRGFLGNTMMMNAAGVQNIAQLSSGLSRQSINAGIEIASINADVARTVANNALEYGVHAQNQQTERTRIEVGGASDSGGGCFFTTAVCEHWKLADDCEVLETMRAFRDDVMRVDPELAPMVAEYYEKAPAIVAKINALPNADEIWEYVGNFYIIPGVNLCKIGANKFALMMYRRMCRFLESIVEG